MYYDPYSGNQLRFERTDKTGRLYPIYCNQKNHISFSLIICFVLMVIFFMLMIFIWT